MFASDPISLSRLLLATGLIAVHTASAAAVQKTAQTITFAAIASQPVNTSISLVATASSGLPVSFVSSTPAVCTVAGTALSLIGGGSCTIQAEQAGNAIYAAAPAVSRGFTVTKLTQTITFAGVATQTVDASVALTASASSGLAVTLASSTPAVCTVTGTTANLIGGGNCIVRASQGGNAIYAAATAVSQTFKVNKLTQTVTFGTIPSQFTNSSILLNATASSGLPVSLTSSTPAVCTLTGATANLIGGGICTIHAGQPGNAVYAESSFVVQSFTVNLQTAAPSIYPLSGTYNSGQTLVLTDAIAGAAIYYTTDGSTPTAASHLYSGPVLLAKNGSIHAIAIANGSISPVASATYSFSHTSSTQVAAPVILPAGGVQGAPFVVSMVDATPGATVYYTTDGTKPTVASAIYTHPFSNPGPFSGSPGQTFQAIALAPGYDHSDIATARYSWRQQTVGSSADVIVYGATPAGIVAAIEAAQLGKQVLLIEPTQHVGGMMTNGLSDSDEYNRVVIGGLAKQFYAQVSNYYGNSAASLNGWRFEPHVAEQIFDSMLAQQSALSVLLSTSVTSVAISGTKISSLTASNGNIYSGKEFIDASYTGDLMAAANVSYTVGRESSAQYGESFGGAGTPLNLRNASVDSYIAPGDASSGLIAHVLPDTLAAPGQADNAVMAYNYRVCFSSDPRNQIPFAEPANYDPAEFELTARLLASSNPPSTLADFIGLGTLPYNKFDVNSSIPNLSTDEVGESFGYPNGTVLQRQQIEAEQKRYMQAFFYFIATDPRIPQAVQQQMNTLGLCKDEFTDNGGWPRQLYVREARRMIGDYVLTQSDLQLHTSIPDSIGVGGYAMDDHLNYYLNYRGSVYYEQHAGLYPSLYPIPYRVLTPQAAQVTNLLVPVDVSASHVAYDSLRVEITYMILGQAAGAAASLAVDGSTTVQDVPYSTLSTQLKSDGVVITPP